MKQEGQFLFLGRTQVDCGSAVRGFLGTLEKSNFDTSRVTFEKVKIEGDFGAFRYVQMNLDGVMKGLFMALANINAIKQLEFPDTLDWVWMDEFIPVKYTKLPGINNEAEALQDVMITIDHDAYHSREERGLRKLRFIGTFNPKTWDNPIIQGFRLLPKGYGFTRIHRDIILEMVKIPEGVLREESAEEWLNNGSARKCEDWLDQNALVEPLPKGAKPMCTLRMKDTFTLYVNAGKLYWLKTSKNLETKWTLNDFPKEGEAYLPEGTKKMFRRYIQRGLVRFPDMNVKFEFINQYNSMC